MLVKCWYCEKKDTDRKDMIKIEGKFNKYYHISCYPKYQKKQEVINQDVVEWEELFEYLKEVFDVPTLSGNAIKTLQDLRNGYLKVHNRVVKRYKMGVPFNIMTETYKRYRKQIDYALNTKQFKGEGAFIYCFKIMESKIGETVTMRKKKEKHDKTRKIADKRTIAPTDEVPKAEFKKKEYEKDISDFLDE